MEEQRVILQQFICEHEIIRIGNAIPGLLFSEIIVDDPVALIKYLSGSNYYISEITWWDRTKNSCKSQIGYGGPRDPRSPEEYYFAETDISKKFSCSVTEKEYIDYLDSIVFEYPQYDLYPGFEIAEKNQGVVMPI